MKVGDVLVSTKAVEGNNFYLREARKILVEGVKITLSQFVEIKNANIFNSDGSAFTKYRFGIKECCEACRNGDTHMEADKKFFESCFKTEEEYTAPQLPLATKEEKVEEKIPCAMVLEAFNAVYGLISDSTAYFRPLYFGRFEYSFGNVQDSRDGISISILEKSGFRSEYFHFTKHQHVPVDLAHPLMEMAEICKEDVKQIRNISLRISQLFASLTPLKEGKDA
jgi:hypothetical protein